MNDLLRDTVEYLKAAGLTPHVEHSRHIKVRFIDAQAHARCIVIARSPSSRFARKKNRALLRRMLRAQPERR
jgi:hypothetical protein